MKHLRLIGNSLVSCTLLLAAGAHPEDYYVDPARGSDANPGTRASPFRSVSAALARLPEVVTNSVQIHLAPGTYTSTGGLRVPSGTLVLDRKMRRTTDWLVDVSVHFLGETADFTRVAAPGQVVLSWGSTPIVQVKAGTWHFENVQLGNRSYSGSQVGFEVHGSESVLRLNNVRICTGSHSGPGILASRGADVRLYGAIDLNEDLHDTAAAGTFCGIVSEYHASVRFGDNSGSLSLGNGSLRASYYGTIELGCRSARVTS